MGQEAVCQAQFEEKRSTGKALLETDHLLFRGSFRLKILFQEIEQLRAEDGCLVIRFGGSEATFELGAAAPKWEHKIRNPRSRIDKLGVKTGQRVAIVGSADESLLAEISSRTADISHGRPKKFSDWLFFFASVDADLEQLDKLQHFLKPDGGIWVIYPKGQKHITEAGVMAASKRAGLVDTKTVGFSATHTGLKVVIPVARRS